MRRKCTYKNTKLCFCNVLIWPTTELQTHTHTHRKSETLAYLVLKLFFAAAFKCLTMVESSSLGVKASCSRARSGAMMDRVGCLSSDITSVASYIGFKTCTTFPAIVTSSSVKVHRYFSFLRTSCEKDSGRDS